MSNFYLGADVSKGYSDFVITDSSKAIVEKNFILDDTVDGHQQLKKILARFFENHADAIIYAAVESTGGYENNWYNTLISIGEELPVKTARLNPRGVDHHKKAALKRTGTDKISALAIAEYQINYSEVISYDQADQYKSMKRLFTAYKLLKKVHTQLLNQLETLLYTANPELVQYRKDNTPKWLLHLLSDYPLANDLATASKEDLFKIPYLGNERAEAIIHAAQNSVASANDMPTKVVIKILVDNILSVENSFKSLEKEAKKFVNVPEIGLMTSIKSIGTMSAIGLFIDLRGDISQFAKAKNLVSYWGIHPLIKDSGDGKMAYRMSKEGRKMPRGILFTAVLNGIKTNPFIQEIYLRELKKGKCKMSAIGVCMHKLARIIFGVLKNGKPFDPEIDRYYRTRSLDKKTGASGNSDARRFQEEDQQAPISRKQTKKRKERKESQCEQVAIGEIIVSAPSCV
jgi:transposase